MCLCAQAVRVWAATVCVGLLGFWNYELRLWKFYCATPKVRACPDTVEIVTADTVIVAGVTVTVVAAEDPDTEVAAVEDTVAAAVMVVEADTEEVAASRVSSPAVTYAPSTGPAQS